ncbi:hypothetical protein ACRRTK_013586 [Alexandromys fortis]
MKNDKAVYLKKSGCCQSLISPSEPCCIWYSRMWKSVECFLWGLGGHKSLEQFTSCVGNGNKYHGWHSQGPA